MTPNSTESPKNIRRNKIKQTKKKNKQRKHENPCCPLLILPVYFDGIPNAKIDFPLRFDDGGAAAAIKAKFHDAADEKNAVIVSPFGAG